MGNRRRAGFVAVLAVAVAALAACGDGDGGGEEVGSGDPDATTTTTAIPTPDADCADGAPALAFTGPSYEEGGDVFVVDGPGDVRQLSDDGGTFSPSFSPDGSEVVVSSIGDEGEVSDSFGPSHLELQIIPAGGGEPRAVGTSGYATDPAWSPDGARIAFSRTPDGESAESTELWVIGADGTDERRLIDPEDGLDDRSPAWSPDGRRLAFVRSRFDDDGERSRLLVATIADGEVAGVETLLDDGARLGQPAFSPDGEVIAVPAPFDDDGRSGLLLVGATSGEATRSVEAVTSPAWASDGRLLAYGQAPGVSDASGYWRVAELAPDGDGFAVGLPVPGTEVIGSLYGGYRVAAPRCDSGVGSLTEGVEPVGTIDVTVPSTGDVVTVLDREAVASATEKVAGTVSGEVRAKLVEPSQLGTQSAEPVDGGPPAEFPLFDAGDEPLVWVVCDDGGCAVVEASTGGFLMGGGGLAELFDRLVDLAPA